MPRIVEDCRVGLQQQILLMRLNIIESCSSIIESCSSATRHPEPPPSSSVHAGTLRRHRPVADRRNAPMSHFPGACASIRLSRRPLRPAATRTSGRTRQRCGRQSTVAPTSPGPAQHCWPDCATRNPCTGRAPPPGRPRARPRRGRFTLSPDARQESPSGPPVRGRSGERSSRVRRRAPGRRSAQGRAGPCSPAPSPPRPVRRPGAPPRMRPSCRTRTAPPR